MRHRQRAIYACDIGSCRRGHFAWARIGPNGDSKSSTDIEGLVSSLQEDLERRISISLGFEAPLFIPVPDDPTEIAMARKGEGNRSFSAGAGASAALVGLQEIAWIMRRLKDHVKYYRIVTDYRSWPSGSPTILLWEAFVSGSAKGLCHTDDAVTAAREFEQRETTLASDVSSENPLSLVGMAALWSGFSSDSSMLHQSTLVLKTTKEFVSEQAVAQQANAPDR